MLEGLLYLVLLLLLLVLFLILLFILLFLLCASRLPTRQAKIADHQGLVSQEGDESILQATCHGSNVHDGCHTSFDKLLLAENSAAYNGGLIATKVRGTYQYRVDKALVVRRIPYDTLGILFHALTQCQRWHRLAAFAFTAATQVQLA